MGSLARPPGQSRSVFWTTCALAATRARRDAHAGVLFAAAGCAARLRGLTICLLFASPCGERFSLPPLFGGPCSVRGLPFRPAYLAAPPPPACSSWLCTTTIVCRMRGQDGQEKAKEKGKKNKCSPGYFICTAVVVAVAVVGVVVVVVVVFVVVVIYVVAGKAMPRAWRWRGVRTGPRRNELASSRIAQSNRIASHQSESDR